MQGVIERVRATHEEVERTEQAIVKELDRDVKGNSQLGGIRKSHAIANLLDRAKARTAELYHFHSDRKEIEAELEAMRGKGNHMSAFYERLRSVKDYYRRYPPAMLSDMEVLPSGVAANSVLFSGEEGGGRYMDLHKFFARYLNIKIFPNKAVEYLDFLSKFNNFSDVPDKKKVSDSTYRAYVNDLHDYMFDFYKRVEPLYDMEKYETELLIDFNKRWIKNDVEGWNTDNHKMQTDNPLYCAACNKVFANKNVFDAHLKGKKHKRAVKRMEAAKAEGAAPMDIEKPSGNPARELAMTECRVVRLSELLADTIESTKMNVERKLARTHDEVIAEMYEKEEGSDMEEAEESDYSSEEEEVFYNPLNLPIGWDGKCASNILCLLDMGGCVVVRDSKHNCKDR